MTSSRIVDNLFEGDLDIVGDVHGEIDALERLLDKMGYGDGRVPDGRRLVFVGDLVDRGPDSPAVLKRVRELVDAGVAQAVVGNHELNALRDDPDKKRSGEEWWYGHESADVQRAVSSSERTEFKDFLETLPVALERSDLRVVHACWSDEELRRIQGHASVIEAFDAFDRDLGTEYRALEAAAAAELRDHGWTEEKLSREFLEGKEDDGTAKQLRSLPRLAERDHHKQMGNPIRVMTSGVELVAPKPFYCTSNKWRVVERHPWWDGYEGRPVIVGHYWRSRHAGSGKRGNTLFDDIAPFEWMGPSSNVMCVDYSVGRRHKERKQAPDGPFKNGLAALRTGSWELWFDDQDLIRLGAP